MATLVRICDLSFRTEALTHADVLTQLKRVNGDDIRSSRPLSNPNILS